jgi:hypothetical protein
MTAVPDLFAPDAAEPLSPVYPFNEPGQPVVLHDGPLGGLAATDVAGVVELSCASRPGLEWRVGPDAPPQFANRPAVTLPPPRPARGHARPRAARRSGHRAPGRAGSRLPHVRLNAEGEQQVPGRPHGRAQFAAAMTISQSSAARVLRT